ncbi:MAG: PRC-barrel domain-containing protein [Chromatiaceae bacterium]|nr:PRC-barrel domain-containing protein [Chromatiaceae bacterium]MCF7995771.1 PRC-barrel domain-containing protein [Chromatiaceae bacterium]
MMNNPDKAAAGVVGAALVLAIIAAVSANQRDVSLEEGMQAQAQAPAAAEPAAGEASSAKAAAPSATPSVGEGSDSIAGQPLVGDKGLPIGEVKSVVSDPDADAKYAVVSVGGFLGVWSKEVTVPMSDLTKQDDGLKAEGISDAEQLYARPAYRG